MATLMQASRQWASRPSDERFTSLTALRDHTKALRANSAQKVISTKSLRAAPMADDTRALAVLGPNGVPVAPTHWAFGQLAQRSGAPASYLRDLPAPLAADCINYGLTEKGPEDVGVLLRRDVDGGESIELAACTGSGYGRVWNATIADALVDRFGDGVTGHFRVPGEFGERVQVTKGNTTLYASDRDMFVFLADEDRRIEMPNRRDGRSGSLARGFFVWNSEVGSATFGVAAFLFDYVCCNRIVWGAQGYREIKIRHTASAPHRWISEVAPALERYAESSTAPVIDTVASAQQKRIDDVNAFLANRFTKSQAVAIQKAHMADEGRPIETLWDAVTGATAYARDITWQDDRVKLEREAGKILNLAA